jgi:hypothetical protein
LVIFVAMTEWSAKSMVRSMIPFTAARANALVIQRDGGIDVLVGVNPFGVTGRGKGFARRSNGRIRRPTGVAKGMVAVMITVSGVPATIWVTTTVFSTTAGSAGAAAPGRRRPAER